ncbi:LysR family transcriptional regulator [Curtobacterium sp. Leaf261]|uniref:LysR family transcriptional regulator n=1 Tax=Curtobacterium sp. Leaf261 TaxID=1736311 RepID=UPI001F202645|nr:LysR family transcriptional regulator [Curtobacterium sp. Leaf261]
MDDLEPQTLRVLRALADVGSITGAATALGISQPAVSQHLQRAEARLGQPLALRGPRGITLTDAGRILAGHAVHVDAALAAARQDLDALGGLIRGRVRLAGFPSASSTLVPDVLARLARSAPGLDVSYVEVEPPEAVAMLREGEVDLALTFTYVGEEQRPEPSLRSRPIGTDPLVLVTPADGAQTVDENRTGGRVPDPTDRTPATGRAGTAGTGGPVDLADHRDSRWIGGCPRCRGHLLASCRASGFTPDIVLETDNAAAVLGLVGAGLGVALLPRLALASSIVPPTVRIDPVDDLLARRIEVAVIRGTARVPSIRAALDAVVALDTVAVGLAV